MTCIGVLATELKTSKSALFTYANLGLIRPVQRIGKMDIYDEEETIKILNEIKRLKKKKLSLSEISEELKKF